LIQNFMANSCAVEPEADTVAALPHAIPVAAGEGEGEAAADGVPADREPPLEPHAVRSRAPETTAAPIARLRGPLVG
jgi:hypothetical protein